MYIVILVTASSQEEASKISNGILAAKLAACVNIVSGVRSFFWWQGKIDSADEVLLVIKSKKAKLKKIIAIVKSLHSYEVPEIIALPIIDGNKDYLEWIDDSLGKPV